MRAPEKKWLVSFADRFQIDDETGCWIWQGSMLPHGYGQCSVRIDGVVTTRRAHRLAWELAVGPIPNGLTIDHLCRNRACVNPDHLEPVTQQENNERGVIARNGGLRPCGTYAAYMRGCRCDACRKAVTDYHRTLAQSVDHGSLRRYAAGGCRCEPCRAASAAYRREYNKRRKVA